MESLTREAGDAAPQWPIGQLILDMPFETYCALDAINSHGLMDILRSPAYFQSRRVGFDHETKALAFGRLVHAALLEPERFRKNYIVLPKFNRRSNAGKLAHKEFLDALDPQQIVVPEDDVDPLVIMAERATKHPILRGLMQDGMREATLLWTDPETGELCKARFDFITSDGIIVDLKTCLDARHDAFERQVRQYRYDMQAAHYTNGATICGLQKHAQFFWCAAEKEPPYDMRLHEADETSLVPGSESCSVAMKIYSRCRATGEWPGYPPEAKPLVIDDWYARRVETENAVLSRRWGLLEEGN
jgi:exodeoxyribonuclease VIII